MRPLFHWGTFWESGSPCLPGSSAARWSRVKEVRAFCKGGFWHLAPLAEGFDPVFIGTAHWAPGPCATLTQKSAGFQYSQTPLLINFILAGKCSLARWVTFTLKWGLKQLNTQIAPPSMWQPCILKKKTWRAASWFVVFSCLFFSMLHLQWA